ncbi:GNAT family N-acetyltransferase [Dyadobacter arcticus]|uniref:N-acetylglutamate synthase-like GNAT family acetyltransferase n=1 Tax=Dyadobacter arcticus TaxID=1078754 RepID=A0ABX0USJ5_9BACT|nr:GNAT family N-acetyltransferase [Dyadobacter arcticus]NIJ55184.1 N-acetylglutamate synthase-like GNAT family acetyltransferase [Dyadobacter arcticus]
MPLQVNPKPGQQKTLEGINVRLATAKDAVFSKMITDEMCSSALARGCGISRRSPRDIEAKMKEGKAVIAVTPQNEWVGFSYIETYESNEFVCNSGLIVAPAYRNCGVAKTIKQRIFDLARSLYPNAKIFSITTGGAVMKMNSRLGFEPVTYGEITREKKFWEGCKSCVNYQTLVGKGYKNCLCTAMLFNPAEELEEEEIEMEPEHYK